MKKISISIFLSLLLLACNDKNKTVLNNYTVYDFLINETVLKSTLNECTSRKLDDKHTCNTVKEAYMLLDSFKSGSLDEKFLKTLGKK